MVAWLDQAQAIELRELVRARATTRARRLLSRAGVELTEDFDLDKVEWRGPMLRELDASLEVEDTSDEDSTSLVPDYARFATDLREYGQMRKLIDKLNREADVDLGAAFGWED